MSIDAKTIVDFISEHAGWTAVLVFLVSFGESFAFISFFFPGTTIMIAAGTLRMPVYRFTVANIASALIWAPALLFAGWLTVTTIGTLRLGKALELLIAIGIVVLAALALAAAKRYRAQRSAKK